MKLIINAPPHIRIPDSNRTLMFDVIIALAPIYALAYYYYGMRTLILAFIGVLTCFILDKLCIVIRGGKHSLRDLSPVVTGLIIPLFMPASIDFSAVIIASVFAMVVAKHPFGGVGENIFNPAAAGIAFTIICYPSQMFAYPTPHIHLPLDFAVEARTTLSTIHTLKLGGIPGINYTDMLFGNFAGALGSTCILVLISCFIYLLVRQATGIFTTSAYIVAVALIAIIFPRNGMDIVQSLLYELMSGSLILGCVFLLNDPVTSPKRNSSRMIYGFCTGIMVMLFRHYGSFDDGVVFAILFANSFVGMIDKYSEQNAKRARRRFARESRKS